jgi:hypothetical protein
MLRNTSKFIFLSLFLSLSSCHFIANYQIIGVWKATEIFENDTRSESETERFGTARERNHTETARRNTGTEQYY